MIKITKKERGSVCFYCVSYRSKSTKSIQIILGGISMCSAITYTTDLLYQIMKKRGKSIGKNCRGFEQVRLKWMVEKERCTKLKRLHTKLGNM